MVIDEAYFEYVDQPDYPNAMQWLDEFPNLLVTRTFSKAYWLAWLPCASATGFHSHRWRTYSTVCGSL